MTGTPTPPTIRLYGIEWVINNGCPTKANECVEGDITHTEFKWDTVEIGYNAFNDNNEKLYGYSIQGKVYEATIDELGELTIVKYLDNKVSFSITNNHPENYGVTLTTDSKGAGIQNGTTYDYIMVFDQTDFAYLPFNSGNTQEEFTGELKIENKFPLEPEYPDVKDPSGKAAPIYPMDMVTRFAPDPRESVTITYEVKAVVENLNVRNPNITIKHTVVQQVEDYGKQLKELMSHTMLGNQLELDYSPEYPHNYPYTIISTGEPSSRGTDRNNDPLKRGDVWFNPNTLKRKQFSVSDTPDTLTIIKKGRNYRSTSSVPCVWKPKDECIDLDSRDIPFGLLLDLVLENGTIQSVSISADAQPSGFQDGDEVTIQGGDNQATVKINIDSSPGWVDTQLY